MVRAQIVGATGYGGVGITEMLLRHPEIEITSLLAKSDIGRPLSDFYPHLRGFCDRMVEDATDDRVGQDADVVVFSTPDRVGMSHAARLVASGIKVLDYSGDFRFTGMPLYEGYARDHPNVAGKPHLAPELLDECVYGVPEVNRARVQKARVVGNPGCFAVAMILALAPAIRAGIVDVYSLIADGKTGISGGGKKPSATFHFPDRNESVTPYRIAGHQHAYETRATLEQVGGKPVKLTFVPHLVPTTRGIITTCYANLTRSISAEEAQALYEDAYRDEPFVRVQPRGVTPGPKAVLGSNLCDVSVVVDQVNDRLVAIGSIDNLLKGQAGVALQNINLMCGLPETMGLERIPIYP
ncbi:MAG: N-acetyl-gamma-glutamyl-phosphate reductase [Chloroflexota bacterium]